MIRAATAAACRERLPTGVAHSPRQLRRRVAHLAAELALRRWLDEQGLPYDLRLETPLTAPDHPHLFLGGRRVDIHIILIRSTRAIQALRSHPHGLLAWSLPGPAPTPAGLAPTPHDLIVFGILIGNLAPGLRQARIACDAGLPCALVASLPEWILSRLTGHSAIHLHYLGSRTLELDLVAWRGGKPSTHHVLLPPGDTTALPPGAGGIAWLHTTQLPDGPIELSCPFGPHWRLTPARWNNLWIYAAEILLAGWRTRQEVEALLRRDLAGRHPTRLADLRPLADWLTRLCQG
ncbi:MAG: hypothetical protein AB1449_04930 [Chloroflexota bacterium]